MGRGGERERGRGKGRGGGGSARPVRNKLQSLLAGEREGEGGREGRGEAHVQSVINYSPYSQGDGRTNSPAALYLHKPFGVFNDSLLRAQQRTLREHSHPKNTHI